jgi:hypothetical protein
MKTNTFSRLVVIGLLLLLWSSKDVSAQQRDASVQQAYPSLGNATTDAPKDVTHLDNGAVLDNATGSVTVIVTDENGVTQTVTYSKPVITDLSAGAYAPSQDWLDSFKYWKDANPNYSNYLSAEEARYAEQGSFEGVYKVMYYNAYNNIQREQLNRD